jgi:N-methylhydantoinase A
MRSRVGIDVGGTFTDFVTVNEATGAIVHTKALSDPSRLVESFTESLNRIGVAPKDVAFLIHATTVVTNLIIERSGAKVGLITTRGFRDVLEIGWSYRRDPYDLQWTKPAPFVPRPMRLEVAERVGPDGADLLELDEQAVREAVRSLVGQGAETIVVCFLHSYANRRHEERAREIAAEEASDIPCVISSDVDPRVGEYERVSTAVLNAYSVPRAVRYIDQIEAWLPEGAKASFMQSEGGVAPASYVKRNPISLVASGPTAGVLAACFVGAISGRNNLISIDVGGTSSDVCVIPGGRPGIKDILEVGESIPIRTECVDVVSIGAGGGSIAWIDEGGALRVGPHSAGADPGPACYALGGEKPTVTDANAVLGIVDATRLVGGRLKGDPAAAAKAMSTLAGQLDLSPQEVARGIYRIVNANMAQAVRQITVQKGIDPREFTLVAFGGAGPQHAIDVAREMQIPSVLIPPHPSTFSALGLLTANLRVSRTRPTLRLLADIGEKEVEGELGLLEEEIRSALEKLEAESDDLRFQMFADLRYLGQIHTVKVPVDGWAQRAIVDRFEEMHENLFGTRLGDPVEAVNIGLTGTLAFPKPQLRIGEARGQGGVRIARETRVVLEDTSVPVIPREGLGAGSELPCPCLVEEEDSIGYLPSGTKAVVDEFGNITCEVLQSNALDDTDVV